MGTLYDCLVEVHLQKYYETFLNHGISKAESLLKLTPRDYGVLGLNTTEERRRLYELINLLRTVLNPSSYVASGPSRQRNGRKRIHSPGDTVKKEFPSAPRTPPPLHKEPRSPWSPRSTPVSSGNTGPSRGNHDTTTSTTNVDNSHSSPLFIEKVNYHAGYNYGVPKTKRKGRSNSAVRDMKDEKIKVCVRKRPLFRNKLVDVVEVHDGHTVAVNEMKLTVDLTSYILQHKFYFDDAFGEHSSNEEVYIRAAKPLVEWVFEKGQATIFAYGQTGAGKTFTMMGSGDIPGLYLLAAEDIFSLIDNETYGSGFHVWLSYYEIYCGQLFDLLNGKKRLHAREDSSHKVCISGLTETQVPDVSSLMQVLDIGNASRSKGSTGANPDSSRSHAILQLQVRDSMDEYVGRISFIDLAGNERAADVKDSDRQSRKEGAEINQSLLALKECIRSLDQESSFTPFRQSKLTHILKDSFTGKSKTCMIANISPNQGATECTLNTLRYADRVKEMRPDTRSPRVMRRKPTDTTMPANKNISGTGVPPSFFHHSNICTSTPIRRQCSDYNPSADISSTTFLDPNESPIQGHRMPRKVSSKFNILPDKITVSKCIPTPDNLPAARHMEPCLTLEAELDHYQADAYSELRMDNIQLCQNADEDEPLTSDFNYDLNDLNKTKKEYSELASEARIIQFEGGAYISPPRDSAPEVRMWYGSSMPSVDIWGGRKSRVPQSRVRNHSDPGLMPSALANPTDDCRIKRQLSSDVVSSHYDQKEEHSSNSTDSDYPIGSPEGILRFPSSQNPFAGHLLNQRGIDTELKTVFPLPPSPPCIKSTPVDITKSPAARREHMHARDIWEKGFTRVTEPHINVSHPEPKSPNPVPAKHLSTTLPNKPHRSPIPEEKKYFRKISRDYSRKDETSVAGNNPNNHTSSPTATTRVTIPNSGDPPAVTSTSGFSPNQPLGGVYMNKLTVAEELYSSFRETAEAVPSHPEKSSSREASNVGVNSRQTVLEHEHIPLSDSKHHHHHPELTHSTTTTATATSANSVRERKDVKETGIPQAGASHLPPGACSRSPEALPDLCVSDIAAMKHSLFQFLQKMSSISKVPENNPSEPSSQGSSLEGAVYPPNDSFEVEPHHYGTKHSNPNRTTNPEVISHQSPPSNPLRRASFQADPTSEIISQAPINAWSPSSPKTGFFPIDPQPVRDIPSPPTLAKSPPPRHVVYPVPFLPSDMSGLENRQEVWNKDICEHLIQAHEKQLATMTMLCKQEMKQLLMAKSGQKSFSDFIEKVSQILSCKLKAISLLQEEIQIHRFSATVASPAPASAAGSQGRGTVFCGVGRGRGAGGGSTVDTAK